MTAGFFCSSFRDAPLGAGPDDGQGGVLALQKTLRIDVDLELEVALGLRSSREPLAKIFRQVDVAQRLHQETKTIAALDDRERRLGRAEHLDALVERRDRRELSRKTLGGRPVA